MKREINTTRDGSKTLHISELNESYHSSHGALQEAKHVFIDNGFKKQYNYEINILELGFGTGLNVLVTLDEFLKTDKNHTVNYFTVEKYPINADEIRDLEYFKLFADSKIEFYYENIHNCNWNELVQIEPNFNLKKIQLDFHDLDKISLPKIDLVYFDCFGARVQPDLWEKELLIKVKNKMNKEGLLTTYASKGTFRRALQEIGFDVEKLAGPSGKREMVNATLK